MTTACPKCGHTACPKCGDTGTFLWRERETYCSCEAGVSQAERDLRPDGRADDVPDGPQAIAEALIAEVRSALIPLRHHLGVLDERFPDGTAASREICRIQRLLDYATLCASRMRGSASAEPPQARRGRD